MKRITTEDMLKECRRELWNRSKVYPKLIAKGEMKPWKAEWHTAVMQAMEQHFAKLLKEERGQVELFQEVS